MAEKRIFNLLKPAEPPSTAWDKVYEWLLGKARIVVLITELIIAVTFVFKVIEDTSAKNKEKEIEQLNGQLAIYAQELEPTFRLIQNKSSDYMSIWTNSSDYTPIINEVFSYITNPSSELSVRVGKNTVSVTGFEDLAALQQLEESMKGSETFTSVGIRDLTLEGDEVTANKGRYILEAVVEEFKRDPISNESPVL